MIALKEAGALLALRLNELVNCEVRRLWDELGEAELLKNSILEFFTTVFDHCPVWLELVFIYKLLGEPF